MMDRQTDGQATQAKTICLPTLTGGDILTCELNILAIFFHAQYSHKEMHCIENFNLSEQAYNHENSNKE